MDEEIWKKVDGYSIYEVSNLGNVRSLNYKKTKTINLLKQGTDKDGYKFVSLSKKGKNRNHLVHRLVAIAFLDNPYKLPQVNHKDEDKTNNCVNNLEWCDNKYNSNYGTRNERISQKMLTYNNYMLGRFGKLHHKSKPINQYTKEGDFIRKWDCAMDVERELGFDEMGIRRCVKNERKSSHGFIWKYA